MSDPIARLALDSRSHGPAQCEVCEEDVEEVFLTDDGSFVCPDCGTPVPGFEEVTKLLCSASVLTAVEVAAFRKTEHCCDDDCRSNGCSRRLGRSE